MWTQVREFLSKKKSSKLALAWVDYLLRTVSSNFLSLSLTQRPVCGQRSLRALHSILPLYFGLHPFVFKNSATKAAEYADTARTVGSAILGGLGGFGFGAKKTTTPETPSEKSSAAPPTTPAAPTSAWGKWGTTAAYTVTGALLAGAAAGAAYQKREDLGVGYNWVTDHMKYVGNLWNIEALNKRVDSLLDLGEEKGIVFRTFYTFLPPTPFIDNSARTFIVLPKANSRYAPYFLEARNGLAPDELQAHTGMFSPKKNDGYYELGLETVKIIREAVMLGRGVLQSGESKITPSDAWQEANLVDV